VSNLATTGFTLGVNNWTAAASGNTPVYWQAVSKT
jgi:hypothetical protein